MISDGVIMIHGGAIVAEGEIREVRGEITSHPIQVLIRCDQPHAVASRIFELEHIVEARIVEDEGLLVRTRDASDFFTKFNRIVIETGVVVETVAPGR